MNIKKKCGTNIEDVSMDRGLKIVVAERDILSILCCPQQIKGSHVFLHVTEANAFAETNEQRMKTFKGNQVGS
jgi:molybdopterin biosynthesis enzyme